MFDLTTFHRAYFKYRVYCYRYPDPLEKLLEYVQTMNSNLNKPCDPCRNSQFIYDYYNVKNLHEFNSLKEAIEKIVQIVVEKGIVHLSDFHMIFEKDQSN